LPNAAEKIGGPCHRFVMSQGNRATVFATKVKSEPEDVRNARKQHRPGAGEIGRGKITPTFETRGDGPAKLISEWTTPNSRLCCDPAMTAIEG
jgi:hypothetical protein